jgi:hypothetical protein
VKYAGLTEVHSAPPCFGATHTAYTAPGTDNGLVADAGP